MDDGDLDEPLLWQWEPSGESCARCEAMAGLYEDEPPARPHAKCDCDVILVSPRDYPGDGDAGECRREMTYEFLSMEALGGDADTPLMGVNFIVHCPDGVDLPVSVEAEIDIRFLRDWPDNVTDEQYTLWTDLVISAALEAVEDVAARECAPCEAPRIG
jgi:hypothetical protein